MTDYYSKYLKYKKKYLMAKKNMKGGNTVVRKSGEICVFNTDCQSQKCKGNLFGLREGKCTDESAVFYIDPIKQFKEVQEDLRFLSPKSAATVPKRKQGIDFSKEITEKEKWDDVVWQISSMRSFDNLLIYEPILPSDNDLPDKNKQFLYLFMMYYWIFAFLSIFYGEYQSVSLNEEEDQSNLDLIKYKLNKNIMYLREFLLNIFPEKISYINTLSINDDMLKNYTKKIRNDDDVKNFQHLLHFLQDIKNLCHTYVQVAILRVNHAKLYPHATFPAASPAAASTNNAIEQSPQQQQQPQPPPYQPLQQPPYQPPQQPPQQQPPSQQQTESLTRRMTQSQRRHYI
tara:strand:+ start:503 stop:1534 length:1032 start_codon:yes stop_codon:yes gene_type:complete